jgi:4-aminobutyrate aminotransferase-like enzyme
MESLLERRHRLLTSGPHLYYDVPFNPVRGSGTRVYDADGKEYIDCYNNVPHVGHCHPYVVEAICKQVATLNTNTRYLFDSVLNYAEKLTKTMPPELDVCLFTCTGSEANDLAWRLAQAYTGGDGALTTPRAYHGNTTFLDMIDGSGIKADKIASSWWERVPVPKAAAPNDQAAIAAASRTFVNDIGAAVDALRVKGHKPNAFYFDTYFCADGVFPPESGIMQDGIARFRKEGGVCIADEVQPGLARTGETYWGFQRMGIVPDMVTLGKPMGNGHPIGVVVTRREIAEAFFRVDRYFNTFAGNPVSSAAGIAVLEVIEKEGLQENAKRMGAKMYAGLKELSRTHDMVGDVRGAGLLLGVELVLDRETMRPASKETKQLINEMCRRGVLIGFTGPNRKARNILKIRPPLVTTESDIGKMIDVMDGVLTDLKKGKIQ